MGGAKWNYTENTFPREVTFFTLSQHVYMSVGFVSLGLSLKVIVWIRRLVNKIRCTGNPVLENSCASITPQKAVTFNDNNGDNSNTSRDISVMK